MKVSEVIRQYIANKQGQEREVGRYYASDVYGIIRGEITPENFFKRKEISEMDSKLMSEGIAIEEYLKKVFEEMNVDFEYQVKKEIQITSEITLIAKCDFHFKTFVAELKRPVKVKEKIPEKWIYQLECYYRAFNLPVYLWQVYYPCTIKQLTFIPNDRRWERIKEALVNFHYKLKEYVKNTSQNK